MAHELDFTTGKAAIAFTGDRADIWHGLGQQIDPARANDIGYLCDVGGIAWGAAKAQLFYRLPDGTERKAPDLMANYRSDSGGFLGAVSESKYETVQPRQIVEFYSEFLANNKLSISTLGSLKGGRIVWALAKLEPEYGFILPGNDRTDAYVRLQTSFDGTRSTSLTATTIRQVCANTERAIESATAGKQFTTRHSATFNAKALQSAFGLLGEQFLITADAYNTLSQRAVSDNEARAYFLRLLDITEEDITADKISGKARNQLAALSNAYRSGPGAQLDSARGTAYGLLNAVTYYADHVAATRDTCGEGKAASRMASAWYGNGAKVKEKARELALALAA